MKVNQGNNMRVETCISFFLLFRDCAHNRAFITLHCSRMVTSDRILYHSASMLAIFQDNAVLNALTGPFNVIDDLVYSTRLRIFVLLELFHVLVLAGHIQLKFMNIFAL